MLRLIASLINNNIKIISTIAYLFLFTSYLFRLNSTLAPST